ncbi:MAG: hypothetical protein LQ350_007646 [Teloschistes chrysophthalmus]|nr:MAG: hypothetical protein LQ350_007646 [Niorma chrysophthalma]
MASSDENPGTHACSRRVSAFTLPLPASPLQLHPLTHTNQGKLLPVDDIVTQSLSQHLSKSWSNPRKRPSIPSDLFDTAEHDSTVSEVTGGGPPHPQKRSRATDWPLRSTDDSTPQPLNSRRANRVPSSPARKQFPRLRPRPSKFLEGSMNDRVSKKPPSIYTGEQDAMERYHNPFSSHEPDQDDGKLDYDAGIENTKPSGMYRFGKALVNAFKPVNVWQGINGIWKDKEGQNQPDKSILQDRKIKAERAYAELKKSGFQGTQPFSTRAASIDCSDVSGRRGQDQSSYSLPRGSSIDVDESHASSNLRGGRPSYTGSEDLLIPPSFREPRPAPSPPCQVDGGRKSSLSLSRPSFPSLKKVKSHMQLPAARRKASDVPPSSPKSKLGLGDVSGQGLRRQPSKKDIAKQKKLSRQVSDLEHKLEAARRELQLSRGQMPEVPKIPRSGRQPFRPGTLPSLPSESIMNSSRATEEPSGPAEKPISPPRTRNASATPKKSALKAPKISSPQATRQLGSNQTGTAITSSAKKRKLIGDRVADESFESPRTSNDFDSDIGAAAKGSTHARKAQKIETPTAFRDVSPNSDQSPNKTPRPSQISMPKTRSPVPPLPTLLDPAKVDTEKILGMRSVPMDHLPFGSHLDDIVNLQKAYPNCSQKQIDQFLLGFAKVCQDSKQSATILKHTVERTGSVSPLKTSTLDNKPGPIRVARISSSPNKAHSNDLSTIEEAITVDPTKDKSIPPMPISPIKITQNLKDSNGLKAKNIDKPLPEIQKENYNWPEDVF